MTRAHRFLLITIVLITSSGCSGVRLLWKAPEPSAQRTVCLTLDDGPNGEATMRVLDVLARHGVRATFFLVGRNVEREPALARRIVAEGHAVGNHSYRHETFLAFASTRRMRRSLERTNQALLAATGTTPRYFRPPNGLLIPVAGPRVREARPDAGRGARLCA
jgi:peptidoglycan/xylan/chitin deacetylase (PgdA/CDA1 family)